MRIFRTEDSVPLGEARNRAIEKSSGDLLAFLDVDDVWKPTKLAVQTVHFQDPQVGLSCTDTEIFNEKGVLSRQFQTAQPCRGYVFRELIQRQWISMSSAMIRREALESLDQWFDGNLSLCEEADVFYRIAKNWKLDFADEPLTGWRVHGTNTTFQNFDKFADETLCIVHKLMRLYPDFDKTYADVVTLLTERAMFQKAVSQWQIGNGRQARKLLHRIAPSRKICLFWIASWFPGSCFRMLSELYFRLPSRLRH